MWGWWIPRYIEGHRFLWGTLNVFVWLLLPFSLLPIVFLHLTAGVFWFLCPVYMFTCFFVWYLFMIGAWEVSIDDWLVFLSHDSWPIELLLMSVKRITAVPQLCERDWLSWVLWFITLSRCSLSHRSCSHITVDFFIWHFSLAWLLIVLVYDVAVYWQSFSFRVRELFSCLDWNSSVLTFFLVCSWVWLCWYWWIIVIIIMMERLLFYIWKHLQ